MVRGGSGPTPDTIPIILLRYPPMLSVAGRRYNAAKARFTTSAEAA